MIYLAGPELSLQGVKGLNIFRGSFRRMFIFSSYYEDIHWGHPSKLQPLIQFWSQADILFPSFCFLGSLKGWRGKRDVIYWPL